MSGGSGQLDAQSNELKPFDSSQMKRGRMGHYGYLEGRGKLGAPLRFQADKQNSLDHRSVTSLLVCNLPSPPPLKLLEATSLPPRPIPAPKVRVRLTCLLDL
jgi:hypothetical protein